MMSAPAFSWAWPKLGPRRGWGSYCMGLKRGTTTVVWDQYGPSPAVASGTSRLAIVDPHWC